MADDTANPTTQLASAASSMATAVFGELSLAVASWRGIIGLALVLGFLLVYNGKWPSSPEPPKSDNALVLSTVANIRSEMAALKAVVVAGNGELGKQIEDLKTAKAPAPRVQRNTSKVAPVAVQ